MTSRRRVLALEYLTSFRTAQSSGGSGPLADPCTITALINTAVKASAIQLSRDTISNLRHRSDKDTYGRMTSLVMRHGGATRKPFKR